MKRITIPNPALEVRDLRVVLALAEARTTSGAAKVLHLSQPAVSRALLAAEEKAGARLFHRTPRGLTPTAVGERLVAGAARVLVELGDLERRVRAPVVPPARVRLVCECYTAYHWLPSALVSLREALPDLEVVLGIEHTRTPVEALEAGVIDVALLTSSTVPSGALVERSLFSDEIVFLLAPSHPLAHKKAFTRGDLVSATILTSPTPPGEARWFLSSVFGRARPRLRFERLPLTEAILDTARAGLGVAVLSEWIAGPHLAKGDLVVRRLATGPLRRPWRIAWRSGFDEAARRLQQALAPTAPRLRVSAATSKWASA